MPNDGPHGRGQQSRDGSSRRGRSRDAAAKNNGSRKSSSGSRSRSGSTDKRTRDTDSRRSGRRSRKVGKVARTKGEHWVERPSPKYKRSDDDTVQPAKSERKAMRVVGAAAAGSEQASKPGRGPNTKSRRPARRARRRETEASEELREAAGRDATKALAQLGRAADAYAAGREREAAKLLRALRDTYPEVAAVRELLGLAQYRQGHYRAAAVELEEFLALTGSVEQHPVLMDCYRAQRRYAEVDALWDDLRSESPAAELVTEGRIVAAGALADRGELTAAIKLLEKRARDVRKVSDHHLRLWYTLADLYEQAGDIPAARSLFGRISRHDAKFADVADRLAVI